jgi:hypothetical protein
VTGVQTCALPISGLVLEVEFASAPAESDLLNIYGVPVSAEEKPELDERTSGLEGEGEGDNFDDLGKGY